MKFMVEFRAHWLPHDWEQNVQSEILSTHLYPKKQHFEEWASAIQSLNVSLHGTASHLDDDHICLQLEAGLDEDLQNIACDAKAHEKLSLHPWIAKIKDLDNHQIIQQKCVAEAVEKAMKLNKKPFSSSSCYANTSSIDLKTTNPSNSSSYDFPPKLTNKERCLLMEHEGCLKCHKFYVGHHASQCSTVTSGKGYKPLTMQDAHHAKAICSSKGSSTSNSNTVASITDVFSPSQTKDFITAVFPTLASGAVKDGSFYEGSDNSFASMSTKPHIKSKHFIWTCSLTGPAVDLPVIKFSLIDNGCHMVLI